ncbi:MAG: hypothetical protein HFJ45_06955 [Clostridia bacterium]|nr:hypothetical protein [Clostridia bacterium]
MENNELNNKILRNVRNKIVVSNLEREESMKITKMKKIVSVCAVSMLVLSGGFFTVNAATDGKLVENIKDVIVVKVDESKYNVTKMDTNENGEEHVKYEIESKDGEEEFKADINKSALENENLQMEFNSIQTEDGVEANLTFYDYNP